MPKIKSKIPKEIAQLEWLSLEEKERFGKEYKEIMALKPKRPYGPTYREWRRRIADFNERILAKVNLKGRENNNPNNPNMEEIFALKTIPASNLQVGDIVQVFSETGKRKEGGEVLEVRKNSVVVKGEISEKPIEYNFNYLFKEIIKIKGRQNPQNPNMEGEKLPKFESYEQLENYLAEKGYSSVLFDIWDSERRYYPKRAEEIILDWWNKEMEFPSVKSHRPGYILMWHLKDEIKKNLGANPSNPENPNNPNMGKEKLPKYDKLQARIDAFVGRATGMGLDEEQIIGAVMMEYNIFYDEAKERVKRSLKGIKRVNPNNPNPGNPSNPGNPKTDFIWLYGDRDSGYRLAVNLNKKPPYAVEIWNDGEIVRTDEFDSFEQAMKWAKGRWEHYYKGTKEAKPHFTIKNNPSNPENPKKELYLENLKIGQKVMTKKRYIAEDLEGNEVTIQPYTWGTITYIGSQGEIHIDWIGYPTTVDIYMAELHEYIDFDPERVDKTEIVYIARDLDKEKAKKEAKDWYKTAKKVVGERAKHDYIVKDGWTGREWTFSWQELEENPSNPGNSGSSWDILEKVKRLSHLDPITITSYEEFIKFKKERPEAISKEEWDELNEDFFEGYVGAKKYFEKGGEMMNFKGFQERIDELAEEEGIKEPWINYIDYESMLYDDYLSGYYTIIGGWILVNL
jgi:hypothetical protein